jgi:hypothetical protein
LDQPLSLRVNHVISGAGLDFRFFLESDRIAALRQPTRWASGHSVYLKFPLDNTSSAQPDGTKMLNSYFSTPIVL